MVPKYTKMNDLLTPQKDAAAPLLPRWMGVLPSSPGWFACAPRQHPRRDTIEWRSVQARARPSCRRWLALFGQSHACLRTSRSFRHRSPASPAARWRLPSPRCSRHRCPPQWWWHSDLRCLQCRPCHRWWWSSGKLLGNDWRWSSRTS